MDQMHPPRPAWRGWLHAIGACVSVPAGVWLVTNADERAKVACGVYAACVTALLTVSASYHRLVRSPRWRAPLRRADHAMIFAVIAGSCTPLCLLGMPDGQGAWLLAMIWVVCALGMAAKVLAFDSTHGVARWLYPLAGWLVVLAVPTMSGTVGWWVVAGLVAAGVSYSVGAVVAWQQWPDPAPAVFGYHEVFHSLTLVGMAVTFAMVASVAGAGS